MIFARLFNAGNLEKMLLISEDDLKYWIGVEIKAILDDYFNKREQNLEQAPEEFVSRKIVADTFEISLMTLYDWTKRGLPVHKQRRRVYYLMSEVREYIRLNKSHLKF